MKFRLLVLILAAAVLPSMHTADGAQIFSNVITEANPSSANPFTSGQTVAANMTASGIGRGTGITANAGQDRYNATSWNQSALDANDYFQWTLTPGSGFKVDFTSLTGNWQRSNTGPVNYVLRSSLDSYGANITSGSIANGASAFNLSLADAAFDAVASAITFRLFAWGGTGGTFSVNDFIFNGDVLALPPAGNNSTITAPASADFGRVMIGQAPSVNFNLTKANSDATTYTATPSNSGISVVTGDGSIGTGNASEPIEIQLANNADGSATPGSKNFTLTIDNAATNSAGTGQGSADPNDVVGITTTVVQNRMIAASAVNFGNVIVGAPSARVTSLTTAGDDNSNTRVTVDAAGGNDGSVTVNAGSNLLFNDENDATARNVSGSFATAGPHAGSINLSVSGEGLAAEAVNPVAVSYTANAFDSSTAAFSTGGTSLSLDFGEVQKDSGVVSLQAAILNLLQTAGYTAELDFDSIVGIGNTVALYTSLADGEFTALAASNDVGHDFLAYFSTNRQVGTYSATYMLGLSDADNYIGAGAAGSQTLSLTLTGSVIPEPRSIGLVLIGLSLANFRRRSASFLPLG